MTNLSHRASFHSKERIEPSNPGIKHLVGRAATTPSIQGTFFFNLREAAFLGKPISVEISSAVKFTCVAPFLPINPNFVGVPQQVKPAHFLMSRLQLSVFLITLALTSQPASAQPPTHPGAHPEGVRWQSCSNSEFGGWFEDEPAEDLTCGYVDTPLIYSAGVQSGGVRLALTRLAATGIKKGSVVVISGGPGLPGINPYLSDDKVVARLRESYDIIGYDPRGVGQSTPKISCKVIGGDDKTAPTEIDIADSDAQVRKTIAACIEQTGAQVLQHIGTNEAVNDLDVIRAALGEARLTAVAYSYGTQVAALYAERFPERTRALVLDGVVDIAEDGFTQLLGRVDKRDSLDLRPVIQALLHVGDELGAQPDI